MADEENIFDGNINDPKLDEVLGTIEDRIRKEVEHERARHPNARVVFGMESSSRHEMSKFQKYLVLVNSLVSALAEYVAWIVLVIPLSIVRGVARAVWGILK